MNHKLHISFRKKRTIQCNVTVGINSFTVDTENDGSFLVVNENDQERVQGIGGGSEERPQCDIK